jgi:signal transduction histidine kinase
VVYVGDEFCVSVKDSGVGIPEEIMPRIFDRFFHTDNIGRHLFGGIGLGLSIAREVVQQHGEKSQWRTSHLVARR